MKRGGEGEGPLSEEGALERGGGVEVAWSLRAVCLWSGNCGELFMLVDS